ncbi:MULTISPECIES: hypothetical protein [unclassified Exiguobacterium]|uniref:hypothetical protein n=1 Tax=unclassified Exiguobacterium TaxID=2644629 RepID=UPI001BE5434F|nr:MULTISPECIES: hypothetical protein [unclassified Exiguobacterium]
MNRQVELTVAHAKQFDRFFGWPVLFIFLISFIVMLRTQATWVIPVMLVVSMGVAYKGYMEYRVIRHFAEHQAVVRVLRYRLIDCWIGAVSLFALFIPMYINEDAFILIGGIVALWGLTKSYREKKWKERIHAHQSKLPTYEEVLEGRDDVWNYHQK